MSHLSDALAKYYSRENNRIIFTNRYTLNKLALAMWEELEFHEIDPSVISRVINGKRLFTTKQLNVFCSVLNIHKKGKEFLFYCLQQDYSSRLNLNLSTINDSIAHDAIKELTSDAFSIFYNGNYRALNTRYELVAQLADAAMLRPRAIQEAIGLNIYLKGRMIANGALPGEIIKRVLPLFNQMINLSQECHSDLLYGYAYILLCTAYYLAGDYSNAFSKRCLFSKSIMYAKKAVDRLPENNHEFLFGLRTMAASASYIKDKDTALFVLNKAISIFPKQPIENYINALHLSITLSKTLASLNMPEPFRVHELASNYFKRDLTNTGVYEVSQIKEEVDTLLILKSGERNYLDIQIQKGLLLSQTYDLPRQQRYFMKLSRAI